MYKKIHHLWMKKKMNDDVFQLSQRNNSSSDKKCIKSIHINTKEFILTPSKKSVTSNNKNYNLRNCYYNSATKKSHKNNDILKLSYKHKSSVKDCINYERKLCLLEKQMKKLDEEKHKVMTKISKSENIQRFREERRNNYEKKQSFILNLIKAREKEMTEKRDKVKLMKNQESARTKRIIIYKKINSENLSEKKRTLKRKILQDISEEKNKINEEKKRKMNLIKIVDDDIFKRKKETEKRKKLIEQEKLEQEIKLQENFNKKLAIKIREYQKIGLEKINFLQQIRLKLENKF